MALSLLTPTPPRTRPKYTERERSLKLAAWKAGYDLEWHGHEGEVHLVTVDGDCVWAGWDDDLAVAVAMNSGDLLAALEGL